MKLNNLIKKEFIEEMCYIDELKHKKRPTFNIITKRPTFNIIAKRPTFNIIAIC